MKKLFMFLFAAAIAATAMAVPARRDYHIVRNSDGTTLAIRLVGDETFHYHVTSDGTPVRKNEQGDWVRDVRNVEALWSKASARRNVHRKQIAKQLQRAKAPLRIGESSASTDTKRGLLILVEFQDVKFANSDAKTKEIFAQMLNGIGNPYGKNKGSVREYFRAQSYNQFDIEFDIVGPVTVSGKMAAYGGNDSDGYDVAPGKMIAEAVNLVDAQVDFTKYDWDGDGEVENIYITYAGYGEAITGADENTIWPHQWQLSSSDYGRSMKKDGVTIDTYACGSELMGLPSANPVIDGIGTMCHEYSHCLGLPDFYDTNESASNFGMNAWSIMDYGCYNGDGFCPAGYTAYERWFSGWLEPVELNAATDVTDLANIEQNPVAYIVYNDANHNEYYLLENHQKVDWDEKAKGHGLLVVHVDYDENAWYNNTVNNTASRQRMTIIPADGKCTTSSLSSDAFPNNGKATALTDESTPAATLYRANTDGMKFMHKPIEDISESQGIIGFMFMGGNAKLTAPEAVSESSELVITNNSFTAKWNAVDGANSYNLRLTEVDESTSDAEKVFEAIIIEEDFYNFYMEKGSTSDGGSDLSNKLDDYTYEMNWSGSAVYQGLFGAKLGAGKKIGYLITPVLENTTGEISIYAEAWDWFNYKTYNEKGTYKTDGSSIEISLLDGLGRTISTQTTRPGDLAVEGSYTPYLRFSNVPSSFCIKISTVAQGKRLYLSHLFVFDGNFTDDEIDSIFESDEEEYTDEEYGYEDDEVKRLLSPRKAKTISRSPLRVAGETKTFEGITSTSYTFTDLTPGATYNYQVQAIGEGGKYSKWSNVVKVTLLDDDETYVVQVSNNSSNKSVFDLSGRRVNIHSSRLKSGIYVVDGKKMLVK